MSQARNGDVTLEYQTVGDPGDVPLLLINGLGGQLVDWDDELLQAFVDRGFFIVRFDNRDTGLSSKVDSDLDVATAVLGALSGQPLDPPYRLGDLADDAVAVLSAAGIDAAHVLGVSLGGMIAQTTAIKHPSRVLSLTSIMSTTGDPEVGQPDPEVLPFLIEAPPRDREAAIERRVEMFRFIGSPEHFEEDRTRDQATRAYDRNFNPRGAGRQLVAIVGSASRSESLRTLDAHTLVIHGDKDRLVNVSGGERTAEVIPGAELLILEGMGHDLPSYYWPSVVEAVTGLVAQALPAT